MSRGKIIALASVTSALSVIFIIIGSLFPTLDLSCLFTAGVLITIPLAKNSVKAGVFAYLATAVLAFIFAIGFSGYQIAVLYTFFFGIYPIVIYLEETKKFNVVLMGVIKAIWFIITLFLMFILFTMFTDLPEIIEKYIYVFIVVGGACMSVIYDLLMKRLQKLMFNIIKRLNV